MEAQTQQLVIRFPKDVNKIVDTLKELGHVNDKQEELRECCSRRFDLIIQFLPRRILNSDGPDLLRCILKGISNSTSEFTKNKVKIIDKVLETMRKESTSLIHCADVIGRVLLELPQLPANVLVRLCNDSVQSIIDDSDVNMIWSDILPKSLTALSSHAAVKHCDTEMSPDDYKEQCLHTLCQCRWREKQLQQLTSMFKEMQLSKNSNKQVVNKICSHIIDVSPDNLPPLVHQLLKLCKNFHLEIALSHLSNYFSTRLYSKLEPSASDSESTTMDVDDISPYSPEELSRCLSTCLYHMSQGAVDPQLISKHIKTWPKTQLLRAPFIIDVALAISDKGADFRTVCLDAIRSAIEQRVTDDLKKQESAWVRSVIPTEVDVVSLIKVLTTESAGHRELTVSGLIHLAFCLLRVPGARPCASACWAHGKLLLVRLSQAQPETAPHVLARLADLLVHPAAHSQYAECLYVVCKLAPASVEPCAQLRTILESCQPAAAEYRPAARVLDAVHPLLNYSIRTRDALVMVCRKGLYSRDSVHRCLALSGFLSILRHMRLSVSGWSQSASDRYSGHSYLTQLAVDMHATRQGNAVTSRVRNEAVGIEVVSILRRCLVQDAAVKHLLYSSIFECTKDKKVLHESILEILYEHVTKYLPDEDQTPLKLDKCVQLAGATAVLTEPIGNLLYAIAQFTQATHDEVDDILASQDTAALLKNKLNQTMEKLSRAEFVIDLEDPGLTDLTPESRAKCIKVQQILQCYEALIAYRIMQWNIDSSDAASAVYKLFRSCSQLLEQIKAPSKHSKKGLNETRETNKSHKSQISQKEKGKQAAKKSNLVKDRAGPFKPLPCVWDLSFCVRVIELLYSEEVVWSSSEQRNQVVGRRDFHHWAVRCVQSALAEPPPRRAVRSHVLPIAAVLYTRCICRFEAMREFDETTALGCLELFKSCLTCLFSPNYSLKMETVLPAITGLTDSTATICVANMLEHIHTALLKTEMEDDEEARDPMDKKIHSSLSATAAVLLEVPAETCPEIANVIMKLEDYIRSSKQDIGVLVGALLAAGCSQQQEAPLLDQLLGKLTEALGRIDEDDTTAAEESSLFPYIDSNTGHAILNLICAHLTARFKCAEHLLHRAKDLAAAAGLAVGAHAQRIDKELKELSKSTIVHMCHLSAWCARCARLRCCIGGGSDKVLTVCVRLLTLLAALAKQTDPDAARTPRFERLLRLSGKKLSGVLNDFILYVERSQQGGSASRVLRDTKLIPRLVLELENYTKHCIVLAGKAQLDWKQYLSLGTARDFKIRLPVIEEMLNARERNNQANDGNEESQEINDAATDIPEAVSDREDQSDEEQNAKRKRKRIS